MITRYFNARVLAYGFPGSKNWHFELHKQCREQLGGHNYSTNGDSDNSSARIPGSNGGTGILACNGGAGILASNGGTGILACIFRKVTV